MIDLTDAPIDSPALLDALLNRTPVAGAVVSFSGVARPAAADGSRIDGLVLHIHPALTPASIESIVAAARSRFKLSDVTVVHRFGDIPAGGTVVFVGASSAHRREAFGGADYMMDRLKSEAVFWKQERWDGGSRWIEPTEADRADLARWDAAS